MLMSTFSDIDNLVASLLDGLPWPAILVNEAGQVTFINREMKGRSRLPEIIAGTHLSELYPQYHAALGGEPPWLTPQDAEVSINAGLMERVCVRRVPAGACLVITESPRREFDLGSAQTARLASLGFMVAGVCHEVANPLTVIHSMVQLLQSGGPLPPETLERGLANIASNVQRVLNITRTLNEFSRGGIDQRTLLRINHSVKEALANTQQRALFRGIEVTISEEENLWVMGVADQIEQVFANILLNAAQAVNGNGQIIISTVARNPLQVEVTVRDTGPGIAPGHLPRLFEPFFTTKPSGQGTGLGLAICNEIVMEHGGSLRAMNHPEGGACLIVTLPLHEQRT